MSTIYIFIELIKNVTIVFDTLIGPYKDLYVLAKLDCGALLNQFFFCDLPVTFGHYLTLQKYTYWYVISPYVSKKPNIYKINCTFMSLCFTKNYFESSSDLLNYLNTHNLTKNLNSLFLTNTFENPVTNGVFYDALHLGNFFTRNYLKNVYASNSLLHDMDTELEITINLIKGDFKRFSKLTKMYHWVAHPNISFEPYSNVYLYKLHSKLQDTLNEHSVVFIDILVNAALFLVFFLFFFKFFVQLVKKTTNSYFVTQKLLKEHDQEVSSFEDLFVFILFFCAFTLNKLNLHNTTLVLGHTLTLSFWLLFILFIVIVILTPISVLVSSGANSLVYIKGAEKYNAFLALAVFDIISMLAFFLRFYLQTIRWCLFLTTYYLLHEFVFEWGYGYLFNVFASPTNSNATCYWLYNNFMVQLFVNILRFVFEFLDTCLILVIQITAFVAVILWLFNYLFSISLDDIYESLFEDKLNVLC